MLAQTSYMEAVVLQTFYLHHGDLIALVKQSAYTTAGDCSGSGFPRAITLRLLFRYVWACRVLYGLRWTGNWHLLSPKILKDSVVSRLRWYGRLNLFVSWWRCSNSIFLSGSRCLNHHCGLLTLMAREATPEIEAACPYYHDNDDDTQQLKGLENLSSKELVIGCEGELMPLREGKRYLEEGAEWE